LAAPPSAQQTWARALTGPPVSASRIGGGAKRHEHLATFVGLWAPTARAAPPTRARAAGLASGRRRAAQVRARNWFERWLSGH